MALFASEVASLEEPRIAAALAASADESQPIAGGVMARSAPGSWTNHAVGLCMDREITGAEVQRLIAFYEERGIEPRVEACSLAHESLLRELGAAGFRLKSMEGVMARRLTAGEVVRAPVAAPRGLTIERVDLGDETQTRAYCDMVFRTFLPPDHAGPSEDDMQSMLRFMHRPGVMALLARIDGVAAGGGAVVISDGVAGLSGAGVRAEYRRRGVQQHLLARRLEEGAKAGARIATVGGKPGADTERNVLRMGFALSYARAVLVKPGEGLVPEMG